MGLAIYVEKGRFVVNHASVGVSVGIEGHVKPIGVNGLLTKTDVLRVERSGATVFLNNTETDLPIAIGYHGDGIGGTVLHPKRLIEVQEVEERFDGLLLFTYSGSGSFMKMLEQFTGIIY